MRRILILFSIPCIMLCSGIYILCAAHQESECRISRYPNGIQVFFSPDDDIQSYLINCINNERVGLSIASFRFTNKDIAAALIDAHCRGVSVEIVVDRGCLGIVHSKVLIMVNHGIPVYTFPPLQDVKMGSIDGFRVPSAALMHNKFILFHGQHMVWTGSYNFTQAAQAMHQENAVMIDDYEVAIAYGNQFQILKQRSTLLR